MMGKVILIASGKGGTGKTMFASNMAVTIARRGKKVVVVDFDMGMRNLDLYMGFESRVVYDAKDVMTGVCSIKQALIRDRRFPSLYMIAASQEKDDGTVTPLHSKVLCDKLKKQFDYILIDAPSGIDNGLMVAAGGADTAIIVTVPEYSSLRDADMLDRVLLKQGIRERYYVLNKVMVEVMKQGYGPDIEEAATIMRPELIGIIQFDENIFISTTTGMPAAAENRTYINENFDKIADRIRV